jgi:hypothetical protein
MDIRSKTALTALLTLSLGTLGVTQAFAGTQAPAGAPAAHPAATCTLQSSHDGQHLTDLQLAQLGQNAGFSRDRLPTAIAVAIAESGGWTGAKLVNTDCSVDRGLWQINNLWHSEVSDAQAYDGQGNANAAYTISAHGASWGAWSTYNNGAYKNFLDRARQAVAQLGGPASSNYFLRGDWTGTGKDGVVEVRPEGNTLHWYFRNTTSQGLADFDYTFGDAGDVPVVGDWNGTGKDGIALARKDANGGLHWFFKNDARNTAANADADAWFGSAGDRPVAGNWDGAGGDGIAVTRPNADGSMHWLFSEGALSGKTDFETSFGNATDTPVAGNWDGVGGTGIGVARAEADGLHWFTANGPRSTVADGPDHAFGDGSDAAVAGNWAGPGAAGIGAVRAEGSSFRWYLSNSATAPAETNNFLFG